MYIYVYGNINFHENSWIFLLKQNHTHSEICYMISLRSCQFNNELNLILVRKSVLPCKVCTFCYYLKGLSIFSPPWYNWENFYKPSVCFDSEIDHLQCIMIINF